MTESNQRSHRFSDVTDAGVEDPEFDARALHLTVYEEELDEPVGPLADDAPETDVVEQHQIVPAHEDDYPRV